MQNCSGSCAAAQDTHFVISLTENAQKRGSPAAPAATVSAIVLKHVALDPKFRRSSQDSPRRNTSGSALSYGKALIHQKPCTFRTSAPKPSSVVFGSPHRFFLTPTCFYGALVLVSPHCLSTAGQGSATLYFQPKM